MVAKVWLPQTHSIKSACVFCCGMQDKTMRVIESLQLSNLSLKTKSHATSPMLEGRFFRIMASLLLAKSILNRYLSLCRTVSGILPGYKIKKKKKEKSSSTPIILLISDATMLQYNWIFGLLFQMNLEIHPFHSFLGNLQS